MSLMDAIIAANMVGNGNGGGSITDKRFGLKIVELTTPLIIGESVELSREELIRYNAAANSGLPAIFIFEIEGLGRIHAVFDIIGDVYQYTLTSTSGEFLVITIKGIDASVDFAVFQLAEME